MPVRSCPPLRGIEQERSIMELIKNYSGQLGKTIMNFLPDSPFTGFLDRFAELSALGLQYLNWFIPVGEILKVMAVWLGCIAVYYAYSAIMRWAKILGN